MTTAPGRLPSLTVLRLDGPLATVVADKYTERHHWDDSASILDTPQVLVHGAPTPDNASAATLSVAASLSRKWFQQSYCAFVARFSPETSSESEVGTTGTGALPCRLACRVVATV